MTFPDLDTIALFNTGTSEHTLIICKSPNKVKEIRNIIMGEHTSNGLMGGGGNNKIKREHLLCFQTHLR